MRRSGMDIYRLSERLMAMDAAAWARHANPWSVYSRMAVLPLLVASVWSRAWIGWFAAVPIGLLVLFTLLNPRLFSPPRTSAARLSWAARATVGERIFIDRRHMPVPAHHVRVAHRLTAVSLVGAGLLAHGLWTFTPWTTAAGLILAMGGKLWFVDRMVWLFEDMRETSPIARGWIDSSGSVDQPVRTPSASRGSIRPS